RDGRQHGRVRRRPARRAAASGRGRAAALRPVGGRRVWRRRDSRSRCVRGRRDTGAAGVSRVRVHRRGAGGREGSGVVDDIFVPALGHAMPEATLREWLVPPGTPVAAEEAVALIETDKAEVELTSPSAGTLGRHRYDAGATIPVGEVVAYVLADGEVEPGA